MRVIKSLVLRIHDLIPTHLYSLLWVTLVKKITHFHTKTHLNQHKTVFFLSFSQRKLVFAIKSEFYVR